MKRRLLALGITLFILSGCETKMKPEEYNDVIIAEQTKIMQVMLTLFSDIEEGDFPKSERTRVELAKQCDASVHAIKDLPEYKGNVEFRDAAVALFTFYKEITENEYKEMIEILNKDDIDVNDILRITELEDNIAKNEDAFDLRFQTAQQNFAKTHDLKLTKNALQENIDNFAN